MNRRTVILGLGSIVAAWPKSEISTLTPKLVLAESKVGVRRASRLISACCAALNPVVAITMGTFFFAAARK